MAQSGLAIHAGECLLLGGLSRHQKLWAPRPLLTRCRHDAISSKHLQSLPITPLALHGKWSLEGTSALRGIAMMTPWTVFLRLA